MRADLTQTYHVSDTLQGTFQVALLLANAGCSCPGVSLLACVVPTRRALRMDPMVAMRVEQARGYVLSHQWLTGDRDSPVSST